MRLRTTSRVKYIFDETAWEDYLWWQAQDHKLLRRINTLLADVARNRNEGIAKPEPLKHGFSGYWCRRINDEHRLVHKVADDEIRIAQCQYDYEQMPLAHLIADAFRAGGLRQLGRVALAFERAMGAGSR